MKESLLWNEKRSVTATVGAPLIIGELTKNSDKRLRYTKLATFGVAARL
jgi:hypothetical protein